MNTVALTGLVKIELPSRTLRFCDGAFFEYNGEIYRSEDDVFGTIGALQTMPEGVGDVVPAINMVLLPPDTTAPIELSQPGNQTARVQFVIAEYDAETGLITTGDVFFSGQIDQSVLTVGRTKNELTVSVVSLAERLFERNIGNTLNSVWHQSIWPGELGHNNATGLTVPVAWGVEAPRRGGGGGSFWSDPYGYLDKRQY